MKKTLFATFLILVIFGGSIYASFPVREGDKSTASEEVINEEIPNQREIVLEGETITISSPEAVILEDDAFSEEDWTLLALWFFLGWAAAHRWYAGKPTGWNILFILTAGGCGIWAIVDLVNILKKDF